MMINSCKLPIIDTESKCKMSDLKCNGVTNGHSSDLVRNPYLADLDEDVLFHLQLSTKTHDLKAMFHDVKFVCMGGTVRRMKDFAHFIMKELDLAPSNDSELKDITERGHRYSMFKVGCVLCVNHGIGLPSITIVLHELIKLMHYSGVSDPIFFRIGTSGGIDVPAGTVVIATEALDDYLEPYFEIPVLGKRVKRPAILDQNLAEELKLVSEKLKLPVLLGTTVSNNHFYESTAMKAGAICEHSDKDRKEYYNSLKLKNVLNMDMEAVALASITHIVGIRAAVVNVVVNDSFSDEGEAPSEEENREWQRRPQRIVAEYIKKYCNNYKCAQ